MIGLANVGLTGEQLDSIGNRWEKKKGETRWYVNDWMKLIGLEVSYYKTGNVADVSLKGQHCSNCWFKKYVQGTKVWVDSEGRVHVDYCKESDVEKAIVEALDAKMEAMLPTPEVPEGIGVRMGYALDADDLKELARSMNHMAGDIARLKEKGMTLNDLADRLLSEESDDD